MARYFVGGGTGNWNSTTNWSATDGGASGASVPTSSDDVFLTAASGANTLTINVSSNAKSLTCTGFTGTLAGSSQLTVAGSVTFVSGMTLTWSGGLIVNTTSTLTSAGKSVVFLQLSGNFVFTLVDDWNVLGTLVISSGGGGGTKTINGNTIYFYSLTASDGVSRIINGTTNLICNAPVTGTISNTSALNNNITINAAGAVTVSSLTKYGGNFITTTSNVVGTLLTTNGTVTLDIGNVYFTTITVNTLSVITLSSNLNCISQLNIVASGTSTSITVGAYNVMFENSVGAIVGSAYYQGTGTFVIDKDINLVNIQFGTAGNSLVMNGSTIYASGNLTILGSTNIVSGTTNVVLNGTGVWSSSQSSTGNFRLNVTFNTAGIITVSGNIAYRTGIITYTAGTIITTGSTLNLRASATLNTAGMVWNDISTVLAAMTITLNSTLTLTGTWTLGAFDLILDGTSGFSCGTFTLTTSLTVARSLTLLPNVTYLVNTSFIITGPTNTFRYSLLSSTPGTKAIFTLASGATQNVGYTNATDIDSSLGQTIYSFNGVITTTFNWNTLTRPTQKNYIF
jgi:hypothetical protein